MRLFYLLLVFALPLYSAAQSSEVERLEKNKEEILSKINELRDSLEVVKEEIALATSKEILESIKEKPILSIARKGSNIKEKPSVTGDIIKKIEEDTPIQVLDYQDRYFKVCLNEICGYMNEMFVQKNKEVDVIRDSKEKVEFEKKRLALKEHDRKLTQERLKEEKNMINKYGKDKVERMKEGYYWTGMNKEMALYSLGEPNEINKSVGQWGTHEQWVYGNGLYIYFENGKLTSFQN